MKEIKLCHTTARRHHGSVSSIWQSKGQLEGVWGRDDAKLMRDTMSWRSYNAIQDGDGAEKLSRDLGEHAVLASHGDNVSTHEIKWRLIKADEIMRAPSDEMFVLARDFAQPIRCFTAPYFRYPDIAGRMGEQVRERSRRIMPEPNTLLDLYGLLVADGNMSFSDALHRLMRKEVVWEPLILKRSRTD